MPLGGGAFCLLQFWPSDFFVRGDGSRRPSARRQGSWGKRPSANSERNKIQLYRFDRPALWRKKIQAARGRLYKKIQRSFAGGHEDEADDYNKAAARWIQTAKDELGASDYKVYTILGNHDLYNNGWEVWKKKIYPYTSYYKFTINAGGASNGGFDFYFLDSGNGTLGGPQIEDLERNLSASSRPKIIFMHYPLYAGGIFYFALDDVHERARLISAFAESNVKYVFEGHKHQQHDYDFNNFKETVIGAYLQERFFGLVTVDEAAGSVSFTRMSY